MSSSEIESMQRWCFEQDFQRLGPSIYRIVETRYAGYKKWRASSSDFLRKKAASLEKGSGVPNQEKVGRVTRDQLRQIAERKMEDLNANDVEAAMHIIAGTARSMGIEVEVG